jgi:hypothetical protein
MFFCRAARLPVRPSILLGIHFQALMVIIAFAQTLI